MTAQKIGELNGKWALLFKILLAVNTVLIVPAVAWSSWITLMVFDLRQAQAVNTQRYETFMAIGPRYTPRDAERDAAMLRAEIKGQLSAIQAQLQVLQNESEIVRGKVVEIEKKMDR